MFTVVVPLCNLQGEPLLKLPQRQLRRLLRWTHPLRAPGFNGHRGAWQATQTVHQGAIHSLDMPPEMRAAHRTVHQLNAVLATAASQRSTLELGSVVEMESPWHATHRPGHISQAERRQPRSLGKCDPG